MISDKVYFQNILYLSNKKKKLFEAPIHNTLKKFFRKQNLNEKQVQQKRNGYYSW